MNETVKEQLLSIEDCYSADTRALVRFLEDSGRELDPVSLAAYAEDLKTRSLAAATINKRLQAAKSRLRLVFHSSDRSHDVLAEFDLNQALKEIRGVKLNTRAVDASKTLSREEIRILLQSKETSEKIRMIIEFLLSTGARVSEAAGIRLKNIRTERGFSLIRLIGKGSKERTLKVRKELVMRIRKCFASEVYLFEPRPGKPYTGDHISAQIRLAGRTLLGRTISAHTMRHTFATAMIRKTRKVKGVSTYLGHSSTSITQDMYVHEELELEDLDLDL
jgi:integrase